LKAYLKLRFFTLLSLFCYTNLSFALSLGDAELRSNLGEKFLAWVNVSDIESAAESSCFSATDVGEVSAFKRASVNLKVINGNYQLAISTNDVITEPIINLRVSFHCEPNVNREYVLLLDPAPISAAEKTNTSDDSANIEQSSNDTKKQNRNSHHASTKKSPALVVAERVKEAPPEQTTVKKAPKKKRPKKISSVDEKLSEAYIGKQNTSLAPQSSLSPESKINVDVNEHKPSTDKPFLVISAGSTNVAEGSDKPGLSLRLATEIDVDRPDEAAAAQSTTDAMDEVTVMSNRLAHLEKQIASLQSRNAELVTEAQISKEENERFDWLKLLKIALGLLVAIALFELLRRKFSNREIHVKDTWFDDKDPDDTDNKLRASSANEFNSHQANAQSFDEPNFNDTPMHHLNAADAQAISIAEKEGLSSIIDDANVFIEHGRSVLAIQLLQSYLSDSPAESPAIWLKLLNLLSKEGSETEYDSAVIECNKHFNIKAAKFSDDSVADDSSIEDYPHIITRLEGVWGSPYAVGFLNDLIFNKRSQPREGLNQGAFNDLFFLKNIAKKLEYANPTIFKASSDQPDSNQPYSNQTSVASVNIENANFNDALFTDIGPLIDVRTESKDEFNDTMLGTKSNFNSFNEETYEVNMIPHDEIQPISSTRDIAIEFEMPEKVARTQDEGRLFLAEEINFSLPKDKVDSATENKANMLNEDIVLDDGENVITDMKSHLDFSLELPNEDKPKTKSKTKTSSVKNQSESNEIEWDLPTIEQEIKPKYDK
jgi:hypothetical protein